MQKLIPLIVLTMLAGAIYTAYGVYSYTPKQLDPPQFDIGRPDPEEIRRNIERKQKELNIPEKLEAKKERIVERIETTLQKYKNFVEDAPQPASDTLKTLYKLMRNNKLPVFYPDSASEGEQDTLSFSELALERVNAGRARSQDSDALACEASGDRIDNLIIGSGRDNTLSCSVEPAKGDVRIYIGGPGDDNITDQRGHAIINAGSGDDIMTTGRGSTIVYIETGWGTDTLNISCDGARLDPESFPDDMPAPWPYKYTNFLVFAPGITPDDIAYKDGVVRHRDTDDKLILDQNCFNYIFANDLRNQ